MSNILKKKFIHNLLYFIFEKINERINESTNVIVNSDCIINEWLQNVYDYTNKNQLKSILINIYTQRTPFAKVLQTIKVKFNKEKKQCSSIDDRLKLFFAEFSPLFNGMNNYSDKNNIHLGLILELNSGKRITKCSEQRDLEKVIFMYYKTKMFCYFSDKLNDDEIEFSIKLMRETLDYNRINEHEHSILYNNSTLDSNTSQDCISALNKVNRNFLFNKFENKLIS